MGGAMRTPKRGQAYQVCVHLVEEGETVNRHFWRLPKGRWLVLCAVCHARYLNRTAVHVEGMLRLFSSAPDLGPLAADTVHVAPRNPPRRILVLPRPPQPGSRVELDRFMLRRSVQELLMSMCLPAGSESPRELHKRLRSLRRSYQKQQQQLETAGSVGKTTAAQLAEIDRALQHMDARMQLVAQTRRRVGVLIRKAQRLLARTLDQPEGGYFYRRRVYRRLLRERNTLASLVWLLNVPDSCWPADWVSSLQDTFRDLQNRYGMPLSDAEMRRLVSHTPLADIAALGSALAHCPCRACLHTRQNTPLDPEQELDLIATCPCALCTFTRTTLPKIDLSKLDRAPTFRDALLMLRRRLSGTSSFN